MSRLVVMQEYSKEFEVRAGDRLVALTAAACHGLEAAGAAFTTVDETDSEQILRSSEAQYWKAQLEWLDDLDRMLWDALPALASRRIRPGILYGRHLKVILDGVFIRAIESTRLLRPEDESVVLIHAPRRDAWPTGLLDSSDDRSLHARIWPALCAHRGLAFEEHRSGIASGPQAKGVRSYLRQAYRWSIAIGLHALKARRSPNPVRAAGLLFLQASYDLGGVLSEAHQRGDDCFVLGTDGAVYRGQALPISAPLMRASRDGGPEAEVRAAAETLFAADSPLWRWPKSWVEFDVASILAPVLREWAIHHLPRLIVDSDRFAELYERENIDLVLGATIDTPMQAAAVAATARNSRTETVLVAHGDGPDVAESWDLHELLPWNHYFVPNGEFARYFGERRQHHAHPTAAVHVGSNRWNEYRTWARRPIAYVDRWHSGFPVAVGRPPAGLSPEQPIIVYVSAWPEADGRYLNKPSFGETWYYRLQQHIVSALLEIPDTTIVVKLYPTQDASYSAIERFARQKGGQRVVVSRAPLPIWIPWGTGFVVDKPSTSLYQLALAGVPFRLLLHEDLAMRAEALSPFETSLVRFKTFAQAASAAVDFARGTIASSKIDGLEDDCPSIVETLATIVDARRPARVTASQRNSH
jgi:hypothetical protein